MNPDPTLLPPAQSSARPSTLRARPAAAAVFLAAFGLLLGSTPARGPGPWSHLAEGRAVAHGEIGRAGPSWLFDLVAFGLYSSLGGAGLAAAKAAAVAALAFVLFRSARGSSRHSLLPAVCVGLVVLAVGVRVPLAPVTASYLLLALAVSEEWRAPGAPAVWPGWGAVALFAAWGGIDPWFALGLATVALIRIGQWLDERPAAVRGLPRTLAPVAVLAAASAAGHLPALLGHAAPFTVGTSEGIVAAISPFSKVYRAAAAGSPAALAFYLLLGMGAASFLLAPWRWDRFLPWAALTALAVFQARAVPFFAVASGPWLAWNLRDFFARRLKRGGQGKARGFADPPSPSLLVSLSACLLAAAFLTAAWAGWLQGPPFEPRRWALWPPPGMEPAAEAVCRERVRNAERAGSGTLHLARDTAAVFAWYCPEDGAVIDPRIAADLAAGDDPEIGERLAATGLSRVVVCAADRGPPLAAMTRLLADPGHWPLLHLESGVAVFVSRRGPESGADAGGVDLNRLAFRPEPGEVAPPEPHPRRRWWDALWQQAPQPAGDREQAAALLLLAEVGRVNAPARHLAAWEAGQVAALAAAAAGCPGTGGTVDVAERLSLMRPPLPPDRSTPPPRFTRYVFDCQGPFALDRDDAPPAVLYAAVRAARRAVSADPDDARAWLLLGQCYLRLLTATRERAWALGLPQLAQLRQAQASAALARAAALNPGLAQAHLELGRLYRQFGYFDLALTELRAYRAATRDGLGGGGEAVPDAELDTLARQVDDARAEFAPGSERARVADRALAALRLGLAGDARALLLESDVSLFGAEGTALEVDLLLRTGRAVDVRDWTAAELKGSLGGPAFYWLRAQARAALGEYAAADGELDELTREGGPPPAPPGEAFALLAGRAVADEVRNASGLPAVLARALAWTEFAAAVRRESGTLALRADAATLRGLLDLESGLVDEAREQFRAALAHSSDTPGGGGLSFGGRQAARGGLRLLAESPR